MQRMHLIASALVMTAVSAASQTPAAAQQPPVNWNAKAPWGEQPNLPFDQQRKAPFKVFDNLWHVGIQTSPDFLLVTNRRSKMIRHGRPRGSGPCRIGIPSSFETT